MFGFSFGEILIIALVALVVVGPDRLPRLAQTLGLLMGRAQRYVNDFRSDLEQEMQMQDLKEMKEEIHSTVSEFEEGMKANVDNLKKPFNDIKQQSQDLDKKLKQNFDEALDRDHKDTNAQSDSGSVFSASLKNAENKPASVSQNADKGQEAASAEPTSQTSQAATQTAGNSTDSFAAADSSQQLPDAPDSQQPSSASDSSQALNSDPQATATDAVPNKAGQPVTIDSPNALKPGPTASQQAAASSTRAGAVSDEVSAADASDHKTQRSQAG